jgi:hypothetical protein
LVLSSSVTAIFVFLTKILRYISIYLFNLSMISVYLRCWFLDGVFPAKISSISFDLKV